jgi:hypothetical protein
MHHIDKKLIRFRAEFALKTRKKDTGLVLIPSAPKNRYFGTGIPENTGRDPDTAGHLLQFAIGDIDFDACNRRSMR